LSLLFLLLGSQKVLAEVFIVTSTLAAGPGTLREAIEKANANGNRDPDFIYFNITRAREYVIYIAPNNPLPALTSNITIDATSQPSGIMGVSDARIGIALEGNYNGSGPLYLFDCSEASNLKFFGLFLKGNVPSRPQKFAAIHLLGSDNVQIGAPDQGNVISGWSRAVYVEGDTRFPSSNIRVSNNIFGLETDGVSTTFGGRNGGPASNNFSVYFEKSAQNFTVGGSEPRFANIFNSTTADIKCEGELGQDRVVTISHNKFGVDYNGDNITPAGLTITGSIAIDISKINSAPIVSIFTNPIITNNYIGGKNRYAGIVGTDLQTVFLIADNILGYEDRSGSPDRDASYGTGIILRNCYNGKLTNNTIRYWQNGALLMDGTLSINVSKNSTYCNRKRSFEIRNFNLLGPPLRLQPFVYINRIDPFRGQVRGKSLPENTIELFKNELCPTCEGKTYLATVQADANGDWVYNGPVPNDSIVATATEVFLATSEYSMPRVSDSLLNISPVTCAGGVGSICGLRILSGTKWRWEDESGAIVGYDTCLRGVPAGKYFLKLSIGSSCEETFPYTIPDVSPSIDFTSVAITAARCGSPNGSICGIRIRNGVSWRWEDEFGNPASTSLCFNNARPGRYRLRLEGQQNCLVYSPLFDVPNKVPRIDAANAVVVHPSCGRNNGSIRGIQLFDMEFSTRAWYNDAGVLISSNTDLVNAAPGRYKLVVKDNSGACGDSTAYFTLNVVPQPAMNTANAAVTNATCGRNNGSITGITLSNITGTANYWWVDQTGRIVATTADLLNVPPGQYRLKVKDGSNCDTLFSLLYTIVDRGTVQLDTSSIAIAPTGCTKITGSITGMKINGATALEWRNVTTNQVVGNTADLVNLPAGNYQLAATNTTYGCSTLSSVYTIRVAAPMAINVIAENTQHTTCGANNGSIALTQLSANTSLFTFRWLKDSAAPVGTGLSISNLSPGTYYCIATDTNGCELPFFKKAVNALPLPTLDESRVTIAADTCEFTSGRIAGIVANSDIPGLQYVWHNINGQVAGNTLSLTNAKAGTYYLVVTDGRGCTVRTRDYNIPAVNTDLPAPRYVQTIAIERHTDARINPLDTRNGTFELRDRATGALIASNTTGIFVLQKVPADTEVYITYTAGPCSSSQAVVRIKVYDETVLTIPNAFSPNNDGINDLFRIQVLGYFKLNYLKIFNRYGQMVYDGRDLNLPWDGRYKGNPLPVGTYYWVIEGIDLHNKQLVRKGSITLIR